MDAFLDFAWKNTAVLGLFFVVYRFWLYPRKQFSFNRHFLLSGLLISVVLPFVSIERIVQITWNPLMTQGPFEPVAQTTLEKPSFEQILMVLIGAGSACVLLWILFKLAVLIKLLIQAKTIQKKRPKLLLSNAVRGPFSFINAIVFPTHLYQSEAYELMLTHEKIHVKQWHSLDILLTHIMFVFTWWNPFLWWYKKGVVENLEFLTDQLTVAATKDLKAYQYILLKQSVPLDRLSLVHPFYHSFLKKRIMMLNNETNKKNPWTSILLAPLLVGFIFTFNTEVVAQIAPPPPPTLPVNYDTIPPPPPPVNPANGYSIPPPPPPVYEKKTVSTSTKLSVAIKAISTDKDLKGDNGYKKLFGKFGVQLSFKNIKRNAVGKITGIKASFKSDNGKKGVYSVSGTEPISDFVFEVSLDQNDQLTEAVFKAAKSKSKVAKGYKSSRVVVRNEEGEILTENVYGSSDENIFIIKDTEGSSLTEKIEGLKGENIFIAKDLSGKVVSENILGSEGKNILVVRTGQKNKDSIMVIVRAEFDEDSLIDSEEQIELLVKKTKDMKAAKEQKAAKGQKMIVVKGAANSWTAESKNKPLIVVDGKIMDKGKNLNEIDPNSIESVNVLKGKSAQEKYGDKGVNGVIEVVTKKE